MYNFTEKEKQILEFWEKQKIFNKLRGKNKGNEKWSFIDGPITANNPMGIHHAWGRTYKDFFHRFKAMQGYDMRYQNGFDCQGLWVEREEEKDLGLKNKQDIENFGVLNFVNSCKNRVKKFSEIQKNQSIRLGYWMDWDNSYYTMSDNNNLHNWFLLKKYFDLGWLYKGNDTVPWCWRCGTASSKHDIITEGYKEVSHKGLFMQFPLKENPDEYFLIFTTTPWTVPANVAIAVNENVDYVKVENQGVKYWLAEKRVVELEEDFKILEKKKGKELKNIEYVMPYSHLKEQKDSPHKVVLWDLASEEEGTGIVHIAPGCGSEDHDLGKSLGFPSISPLDEAGCYKEGFEEFSFKKYSEVNESVLKDLEQRRFTYKITKIKHRYPHCWRCGEELVFRLVDEWYIKSKDIKPKLIEENEKISWYPEYGKIRQRDWFNNMGDWLISRKRYWGLPLPIWECKCGHVEVIGSLEELKEKAVDKKKVENLNEIHRPWIDEITIKCPKCKEEINRIKDVGDAWLDAGIVPLSTLGYLNDNENWKQWFPAELISENLPGQYRGWFNALFWASVTLTGKAPFKSLYGYETLKDEKGNEMHKSKGNAIWFDDAVERTGADPIRLLYCLQDPSQELKFGYNVLREPSNNLNILYNIGKLIKKTPKTELKEVEDKWIISKINSLKKKVKEEINLLHVYIATRAIEDFWLNDLSRGYIQIIRERLAAEDNEANFTLSCVYTDLIKMCSLITPFLTENVWQELKQKGVVKEESIHLCSWPEADENFIDEKLESDFEYVLKIIESGLRERDQLKIGLKWPLSSVEIGCDKILSKELIKIINQQLNVKKSKLNAGKSIIVKFDTLITPELESEGYAREISRKVQSMRKQEGMVKQDLIDIKIVVSQKLVHLLNKQKENIRQKTNSEIIEIKDKIDDKFKYDKSSEYEIKDDKINIYIKKR